MPITDQTVVLTQEQIANRQLRVQARTLKQRLVREYEQALKSFWQHEQLTPQQMSDALGTDAGDFFSVYGGLKTYIENTFPNVTLTQPSSYGTWTVNGDGSVTIDSVA
jgi:hypothetical protein